ncbi:hypothetical protein B7494_g3984 [Chlorociboria aeruginascens]|nr:hypothetical protein B7494_g3984 [Chlorociboria aeruginascens]
MSEHRSAQDPFAPVIFSLYKVSPDVRITVFGKEFHVHSLVLRVHSEFFGRFLICQDQKQGTDNGNSSFKYEYVAVDDGDGYWGLQPQTTETQSSNSATIPDGDAQSKAIRGIHNLLKAFYSVPNSVINIRDLKELAHLADYYLAQPIVLMYVNGHILNLLDIIPKWPLDFMRVGIYLRSPFLFKEAFVHIVGKWGLGGPDREAIKKELDITLLHLVERYHGYNAQKLADANMFLLLRTSRLAKSPSLQNFLAAVPVGSRTLNRNHYCELYRNEYLSASTYPRPKDPAMANSLSEIQAALTPILKSYLYLDRNRVQVDTEDYNYFLCTNLADQDIPWLNSQAE